MEKLTTAKAFMFLWKKCTCLSEQQCLLDLADSICWTETGDIGSTKTAYVFSDDSSVEVLKREVVQVSYDAQESKENVNGKR